MLIDVVTLPALARPDQLAGRAVVVFDVLRATTVISTALANGADRVWVFDQVDDARAAAAEFAGPKLLIGERHSAKPEGFDFGNSPRDLTPQAVGGRTVFMTTTNGTHAIVTAAGADDPPAHLFAGCVENAAATARRLAALGVDVTLLCAGTDRLFSFEDFVGCGAVADRLAAAAPGGVGPGGVEQGGVEWGDVEPLDAALAARSAFLGCADDREGWFARTRGGHNIRRVGQARDILDCATPDRLDVACRIDRTPDGLCAVRA